VAAHDTNAVRYAVTYFGQLRAGRSVACASGWYEWTGEKGHKQPWHIHSQDRESLFLLALANFNPLKENSEEAGFVLVTVDSVGGMIDIHDRSPVAVNDTRRWLNSKLTPDETMHIAHTAMLNGDLFEWHADEHGIKPRRGWTAGWRAADQHRVGTGRVAAIQPRRRVKRRLGSQTEARVRSAIQTRTDALAAVKAGSVKKLMEPLTRAHRARSCRAAAAGIKAEPSARHSRNYMSADHL
jgi:hypothetical protein